MKFYIPSSKGWYVAVALIFVPLLLILFVEPTWVGRMIGIGLGYILLPVIILVFSIYRTQNYFDENSPLYKRFDKNKVDLIARLVLILFAVGCVYTLTWPFSKDVLATLQGNAPVSTQSYVASTRVNSITGLILERVITGQDIETKDNTYNAFFFAPRHIMHERTYDLLYLPHSRIILEADTISE